MVKNLYEKLINEGFSIWFDEKNLLPGQNWEIEIKNAIRKSIAVIVCLSKASSAQRGYIHKELSEALEIKSEIPYSEVFLIPVRLDNCSIPVILENLQWVDFFNPEGVDKIIKSLWHVFNIYNNVSEANKLLLNAGFSIGFTEQKIDTTDMFNSDEKEGYLKIDDSMIEHLLVAGCLAKKIRENEFDILKHYLMFRDEVWKILIFLLKQYSLDTSALCNAILRTSNIFKLRNLIGIAGQIGESDCVESICIKMLYAPNYDRILREYKYISTPFTDIVISALSSMPAETEATIKEYIEEAKKMEKWKAKQVFEKSLKLQKTKAKYGRL